ncbi:hypothetical protein EDC04DRAFT_2537846, partial [Pisolithus marmoratus]
SPYAEGAMALYLTEGGDSTKLLALLCHHILLRSDDNYICHPHGPHKDVVLLSLGAFTNLLNSINLMIKHNGVMDKYCMGIIELSKKREQGTNTVDVEEAKVEWIRAQKLLDKGKKVVEALQVLLHQVKKDWKKLNDRVIGHILCCPPIHCGVSEEGFTKD